MQKLLQFQPCPQSAEKYFFGLNLLKKLTIIGLLADLDLPDLGALVTGPTSALNFLAYLQTVEKDIELLP